MKALENPHVDYLSIKLSTLHSQINPLSFKETVNELVPRIKKIFKQAQAHPFRDQKGHLSP